GKYLVIQRSDKEVHSPGTIALVGGKLDLDAVSSEALETALRREVKEEVGLSLGLLVYVESKTFKSDNGEMCLSIVFLCEDFKGVEHAASPDEVVDLFWLSQEEIKNHPKAPPWTIQSIESASS
ncbi:NUDIX domain-containing protein, partial [Patescibacteria group bacterium]|nr:NUDIX domain-containing protein [Patescibacteria group bacterium]